MGAGLSQQEAAARCGLPADTVGRWARRFGWRRASGASGAGAAGGAGASADPSLEGRAESTRSIEPGWGLPGLGGTPPRSAGADSPSPEGEGSRRRVGCAYGPEVREAARVRIEGSRVGLERIGLDLGVDRWTLYRWCKRFGWRRPAPPDKAGAAGSPGAHFYRSRRFGRPYGGDAVGTARDLVLGSTLPVGRIAARAGVSRATVYRWMKRPGWTRHGLEATGAARAARATWRRYRPPYGPAVVAAARELYEMTELPVLLIAARLRATPERVRHWARIEGWARPSGRLGPTGCRRG